MEDRMKLNDAGAFYTLGSKCKDGMHGIKTDYKKAFELMSRAAELGSTDALYHVGFMLYMGQGVKKNVKKAIETFEIGAMRGCENARFNLAGFEPNKQKANKHLMIAARQGVDDAMKLVKDEFKAKRISKDEFEYTKSKYEEMVESLKSEQRDNAASLYKALGGVLDM
jgi:TPR repeat protein